MYVQYTEVLRVCKHTEVVYLHGFGARQSLQTADSLRSGIV